MKKYLFTIFCILLSACGTFDIHVQISPKATETELSKATMTVEPVLSPTPTQDGSTADVSAAGTEVYTAISGREAHTCALTAAGAVKCWGLNNYGQLGEGTTSDSLMSMDVNGLGSGVTAISAGEWYTCALTAAGAAKCWGLNNYGQLGDGTTTDSPAPVDVSGLGSGITAVKAGRSNTCILTQAGGVKCWGLNDHGQLGNGTTINSLMPVDVSGLSSGVTAISIGASHTCALTREGAVKCWGLNADSELGNGTTTNSTTPVDVNGLGSGVTAIAAGIVHNCALTTGGAVKCWGYNRDGELGNGATTNSPLPVDVRGLGSGIIAISAGTLHTCALTAAGAVKCWGYNASGQLGNGTTANSTVPVDVRGLGGGVTAIAAGSQSCALIAKTVIKCWGLNSSVGTNVIDSDAMPTDEPFAGANALQAGQSIALAALQMNDTNHGWAVESSGHIVRTSDGGATWKDMTPFQDSFGLRSLFALNNQAVWVVPAQPQPGSVIWRTQDSGVTWKASQPLPLNYGKYRPLGLQFPDARHGWLLLLAEAGIEGSHILLYKSADGGAEWEQVGNLNESVTQSYLPDTNTTMSFFDGQTGWLGGWWGKDNPNQWMTLKTTDGGANWETGGLSLPDQDSISCDGSPIADMAPGSMAVEMTCTNSKDPKYLFHRVFYLSPNGPPAWRSWKISGEFLSAYFLNPSQGWMMLTSEIPRLNQVLYTQDGGNTWAKVNDVSWRQAQFDFVNSKEGWAVVGDGFATALVHTENSGKLWVQMRPVVADY